MPRKSKRGNNEGTIYQRPDGRWTAQVTTGYDPQTGKQRRKTVYGFTRGEVATKLDTLKEKAREGVLDETDMTVGATLDFWLATVKHTVAADTVDRYRQEVEHLRPYLGRQKMAKLTALQLTDVQEKMAKDALSTSKRRRAMSRLRQALAYAVKVGLIRTNPATRVPLPRHRAKEMHPLTPEQVTTFLTRNRQDRLFALWMTAVDTGARQGELFALDWTDWDSKRAEITISKSLKNHGDRLEIKEPKTPASRRRIRVSPETAAALEEHRVKMAAEGHNSPHIFSAPEGGFLRRSNFHRDDFKPAARRAGLPANVNFHDLRHTCATLLLLDGVNVKMVASRLGHSTPKTTLNTYSHVIDGMQEQAAATMGRFLRPTPPALCPDKC